MHSYAPELVCTKISRSTLVSLNTRSVMKFGDLVYLLDAYLYVWHASDTDVDDPSYGSTLRSQTIHANQMVQSFPWIAVGK
jgi:hypothetical protein